MPTPGEELDWATQTVVSQWVYAYDRFEKVFKDQLTATLNAADPRDLEGAVRRSAALAKQMEALRESIYEVAGSTSRDVVSRLPQVVYRAENLELKQMIAQLPPHQFAQVDEALRTRNNLVGQDVTLLRADPRSIAAIIRRTTERITSKNYMLSFSAIQGMKQALLRAIPEGMNPKEAARLMLKNVRGEFNGGVARALTIARTEMIDAHRSAATEARRANLDVLAGWQWHADLSDRTCRACLSMHGRAFPAEQSGPDGHPNCRCTAIPITKTWEELGIKGVQETRVVVDHREASKWFKRQSMSVKRRILTQKGLDAWYKDEWSIQDWAQEKTNVGWRKSWNAGVPGVRSGVSYPSTYSTKMLTQGNTKTRVKTVPPPKVTVPTPPTTPTPPAVKKPRTSKPKVDKKPRTSKPKVDTAWLDDLPKTARGPSTLQRVVGKPVNPRGDVNPMHGKGKEYSINCSRCAAATELRARGYDVRAAGKPRDVRDNYYVHSGNNWMDPKTGKLAGNRWVTTTARMAGERYPVGTNRALLDKVVADAEPGYRYLVSCTWDSVKSGHIWNGEVIVLADGTKAMRMVDGQVRGIAGLFAKNYINDALEGSMRFLRVDDLVPVDTLIKGTKTGNYTPWIEY